VVRASTPRRFGGGTSTAGSATRLESTSCSFLDCKPKKLKALDCWLQVNLLSSRNRRNAFRAESEGSIVDQAGGSESSRNEYLMEVDQQDVQKGKAWLHISQGKGRRTPIFCQHGPASLAGGCQPSPAQADAISRKLMGQRESGRVQEIGPCSPV
jgi:hypothetical protein